jgi:hypothetical protein
MRGGLEVVILADGFVISFARRQLREELRGEDLDLGREIAVFCEKHEISSKAVHLFIAEDLVYGVSLDLPLRTPDLKEAVGLQLGLILPFSEEEALSAYSVQRRKEGYRVMAFAARAKVAAGLVDELIEDGYTVKGLYPENQRYVTARMRRRKWALVMPGRQNKILIFDGARLEDRLLLAGEKLSYDKLTELSGTGLILHSDPPRGSSFIDAQPLLSETPLLHEFNLLPDSYRRPDYLKMVVTALVVLNLLALGSMIWFRFDHLTTQIKQTDAKIAALTPLVAEVDKTKAQIKKVEGFVTTLKDIGKNPDLIGIMQTLTSDLPSDSYLDLFKFDSKGRLLTLNGYANDLTELTGKLKNLGEVRLKSTSRRKDRNYFQVEIALHD